MRLVVADASALLEYLFGTDAAAPIRKVLRNAQTDLHVPALCDVEVASGLRRAVRGKVCSVARAADALKDYGDLPLTRHGHRTLLPHIFALHENFSACDATYVALADALGAALLTADTRLARAVRAHAGIALA